MAREQQVKPQSSQQSQQSTITQEAPQMTGDHALQETAGAAVSPRIRPTYPTWPTSKPGPRSTPPPPGMRSTHPFRPEQVTEIAYNQETGEPSIESPLRSLPDPETAKQASLDQQETVLDAWGKRKKRL